MPIAPPVDGPPPSPATDPAAARETGQQGGVANLAQPMQMQGSGPDLSGLLQLGEKLVQGALALAQAAPAIAPEMNQIKELLMAALGKVSSQSPGNGSMPGANAKGTVVTQAGPQFPGGGQGAGRPF